MNSSAVLNHFSGGVGALLGFIGGQRDAAAENEETFGIQMPAAAQSLAGLDGLAAYLDVMRIFFTGSLQEVHFRYACQAANAIECREWSADEDMTPPALDAEAAQLYADFSGRFSTRGAALPLDQFAAAFARLQEKGAEAALSIHIQIDKQAIVEQLSIPAHTRCLLYVLSAKLQAALAGRYFWELEKTFGEGPVYKQVILLADARGRAKSAWLEILGRDEWDGAEAAFGYEERFAGLVDEAGAFRKDEVSWDFQASYLSPFAFAIQRDSLDQSGLIQAINGLCVQMCVCFLANRAYAEDGQLVGEFAGQKRLKVFVPRQGCADGDAGALLALFRWAYENSKSDKLNLTRQVISASLAGDPAHNLAHLLAISGDVQTAARSNYCYYLRKDVGEYFEKRQKVIQFLQDFAKETNEAIAAITSDLVGNLYKTIGIIVADMLAILVNPSYTPVVIHWTALLYLAYIAITLAYALSFVYLRFYHSNKSLSANLAEFPNLLTGDELQEIRAKQYRLPANMFRGYFIASSLLYAALGATALAIVRIFG